MTPDRWIDPELDELFADDADLRALAGRIRDTRPEPPLDERFPSVLRAQLMREAEARVPSPENRVARDARASRQQRSSSPRRAGWLPWSRGWNAAGVLVVTAAAAAIVLVTTQQPNDHVVTAASPVADTHAVSPDNVITVAFSQPMDHNAVVAGLHITPATTVTTSWNGNNLIITPTHHLAGNTSYTVTIAKTAARAANGSTATAPITIAFGTAPTPPPAPQVAPLDGSALGPADAGAVLVAGPDGSVIASSSTGASSSSPPPTAAASPAATAPAVPVSTPAVSATPSASASASPSASAATATGSSVVRFDTGGGAVSLGPASSLLAVSPDGLQLLSAVSQGSSTAVTLTSTDGRQSTTLTTVNGPVLGLGWLDSGTALVAESDHVESVDLTGTTAALASVPAGTTTVQFAPTGGMFFAGSPSADGQLLDSHTGQGRTITGSRTDFAFSGDGQVVAWVDATGSSPQLMTSPVSSAAAVAVPIGHPGDAIGDLALDASGGRVAFIDPSAPAADQLAVESVQTGTLIAQGSAAAAPLFVDPSNIAFLTTDGNVAIAGLPVTSQAPPNSVPPAAANALQAFVDAQASGDSATMTSLAAAGVSIAATPTGLSRGYVISVVANPDHSIDATARLIVDASATHPVAQSSDETITLGQNPAGSGYVVTALNVAALRSVSVGPHILGVVPAVVGGQPALLVTFDSDLNPASVASAVTVTAADGTPLTATTTYDPESRTATVVVNAPPGTVFHLAIATSLHDVNGAALASGFTVSTAG